MAFLLQQHAMLAVYEHIRLSIAQCQLGWKVWGSMRLQEVVQCEKCEYRVEVQVKGRGEAGSWQVVVGR